MPQPDFNKLPALPFTLAAHLSLRGALSCSAPISICWRASSEVYGRTILGEAHTEAEETIWGYLTTGAQETGHSKAL